MASCTVLDTIMTGCSGKGALRLQLVRFEHLLHTRMFPTATQKLGLVYLHASGHATNEPFPGTVHRTRGPGIRDGPQTFRGASAIGVEAWNPPAAGSGQLALLCAVTAMPFTQSLSDGVGYLFTHGTSKYSARYSLLLHLVMSSSPRCRLFHPPST